MVKKIMQIFGLVILIVIILGSFIFLREPSRTAPMCKGIQVLVTDTVEKAFISINDVKKILKRKSLLPTGYPMDDISTQDIENALTCLDAARTIHCYKSTQNNVVIRIQQRTPLLRVFTKEPGKYGTNYFVDIEGQLMKADNCYAPTLVATGYITDKLAQKQLYHLAQCIKKSAFWDAQVTQIFVTLNAKVTLYPRVGQNCIQLGGMTDIDRKLDRMERFYHKVIKKVGWQKYSCINLSIPNQIICTKREN